MDEVWVADNLLAFDGRVLELFGHPASPSARYHVENLELTVGDPDRNNRRMVTIKAATRMSGSTALTVPPDDWPAFESFLDRVFAAMPD